MKTKVPRQKTPDYALAKRVLGFLDANARRRSGGAAYDIGWLYSKLEKLGVNVTVRWEAEVLVIGTDEVPAHDHGRTALVDVISPLYTYCFNEALPRDRDIDMHARKNLWMMWGLAAFRERIRKRTQIVSREVRTSGWNNLAV